eukprot:6642357-Alexandrium_andersonii.AAC.1
MNKHIWVLDFGMWVLAFEGVWACACAAPRPRPPSSPCRPPAPLLARLAARARWHVCEREASGEQQGGETVSYTHLRAHETSAHL